MTELDMLIERTARLEPPKTLPPRELQMRPRLQGEFQGGAAFVHSQPFSRPLSGHTLSDWGTMRLPPSMH